MNSQNHNRIAGWAVVPMFVFLTAAASFGAVLLEDGFTDPVFSDGKWLNSLDNDKMSVAVGSGSCSINNTSRYSGEYYHTFGTKPSTFTISFVLKSVSRDGEAGVLFCRNSSMNGYYLTISDGKVALYKFINGSGSTIYFVNSPDIKAFDNKFTVSKQGSEIHLFLNDVFQGKVTDAQYGSGDFALFLSENTSAVFGPVRITDEFTGGGPRTSFADNFDNGRSKYWQYLDYGSNPEFIDENGALTVKTSASGASGMYVGVEFTDFEVRVDVQHVSGGSNYYGIILKGPGISTVSFGITGDKKYSVWSAESVIPEHDKNPAIKGSAGDLGVVYIDKLEVFKKSGSSTYEFKVNGTTISNDYPVVDFPIMGVGVFTYSDIWIRFDNFEAKKEGTTSIKFVRNPNQSLRGGAAAKNVNNAFYDLRGRKRYVSNPQSAARTLRASGVYVNQSGREVLTDRNKRTR